MLPSFHVMSNNQDVGKQMASMRSYLAQLKDELENELQNISYTQLDADLRKRFDDLGNGLSVANQTTLEVAGLLKTKYLKADEIAATYITAQTVAANYATIGSLNAVSAAIGNLEAIAITTQNLSAQTINGSQITGLTINANQITAGKIKASQVDSNDLATNAFVTNTLWAAYLETGGIHGACPDVLGGVFLSPRWQYNSSLNRYMLVSQETGQLG